MTGASSTHLVALGPWLEARLSRSESEILRRGLRLRIEIDPDHIVALDEAFGAAWAELCRLILSTAPNESEIYFGSSRSIAPVSRLGGGQWSVRWQVVGEIARGPGPPAHHPDDPPSPISPRAGDANYHAKSPLADRVRDRFAKTPWAFSLEALESGTELLAQGWFR